MRQTFRGIRASASYKCSCSECGKQLTRQATAEHTVNPYNKDADGNIKSPQQVREDAQKAANQKAKDKSGMTVVCRKCQETPLLNLIVEMLDTEEPVRLDKTSDTRQTLVWRDWVANAFDRCECCDRLNMRSGFYELTFKGRQRAEREKQRRESLA